jgi:hypothetical protein
MAAVEAFKRGDEVLSKFPGGSLMMVLAVEGLKVRCTDQQNTQYWFDTIMLQRYEHPPSRDAMKPIGRPQWTMCPRDGQGGSVC